MSPKEVSMENNNVLEAFVPEIPLLLSKSCPLLTWGQKVGELVVKLLNEPLSFVLWLSHAVGFSHQKYHSAKSGQKPK